MKLLLNSNNRADITHERPADLPIEKAYSLLKIQLERLQELKGSDYREANAAEDEWIQLTEKLVQRSFGGGSTNYGNILHARAAGEHYMHLSRPGAPPPHAQNQRNFEARQQAYEAVLRSCIAELEIDLPEAGIKGTYKPGEEYEFYRDVTDCSKLAQREIFIIDPYLNTEIFDVYARAIPRTITFRLLSANISGSVLTLAQKYANGGNLAFRSSVALHDRVFFSDDRGWVSGQSLKDAARKKPTYIVEFKEPLMRKIYEEIWETAAPVI